MPVTVLGSQNSGNSHWGVVPSRAAVVAAAPADADGLASASTGANAAWTAVLPV